MTPKADASPPQVATPLLEVRELHTRFGTDGGDVRAVDGVSFDVARGEILGIVGESGCGKSATSLSILRLLPRNGRIASGNVLLSGTDLVQLDEPALRAIRGRRIAMIFQDPMTCLNPYLRIREQLTEAAILHLGLSEEAAERRALALLDRVRIPDAAERFCSYPHELSGGMRQRVMIAMALLCDPELLIADEPTTALDVTIQAQILEILLELRRERGLSILLITHDLGVVSRTCDRVLVMYAGRIVETAPARALFRQPYHPYTAALLKSLPRIDTLAGSRLESIQGMPPRLNGPPFTACTFAPRCRHAHDRCVQGEPALKPPGGDEPGRLKRCVLAKEQVS